MLTIELDVLEQVTPKTRTESSGVATWESLHPDLRKSIERGDADIAAGRVCTSEEVFREIDEWLEKD